MESVLAAEVRKAAHAANETMVQCEGMYFTIMHKYILAAGQLPCGLAADGWMCKCERRNIPAME